MQRTALLCATLCTLGPGSAWAQASTRYALDPTHTSVMFEALHYQTSTVRGRWQGIDGSIVFDPAQRTGQIDIVLDTRTLVAGVPLLEATLKGEAVFDVARYPQARFVADTLAFDAGGKLSAVSGALTLLGRSQPVTLSALHFNCYDHPRLKREVCGGDFETRIRRSAWGMTYGLPVVPDDIRLLVQIEAIRQ